MQAGGPLSAPAEWFNETGERAGLQTGPHAARGPLIGDSDDKATAAAPPPLPS